MAKIREALQQGRKEHELKIKALKLSHRTTQQLHTVWNEVMGNPLVIPTYGPESTVEPQPETRSDEDKLLHEELRKERERQIMEEAEQEPPTGPMEAQAAQEDNPLSHDNTWTHEQCYSL